MVYNLISGSVHVQLYPLLSEIDEASFGQFGVPLSDDVHLLHGSDPSDIFNILRKFIIVLLMFNNKDFEKHIICYKVSLAKC